MLTVENVTVARQGRVVLRDVSARVEPGRCLTVIGPNGAGKSTLLSAMAGLLPVQGGRVLLGERAIGQMSRREVARQVAFVAQTHEGFLGFRVGEVLEAARYPHVDPLEPLGPADLSAVAEAAERCRITGLLDRTMDTLSGGERQRVWIAAALAQQTPLLLLDEPASNLDPAHQVELVGLLRTLAAEGRAVVSVCHDLNMVLALGGQVLGLGDGRVRLEGPAEALLDADRLAPLFDTSFENHLDTSGRPACVHVCWRGGR